ncbi:AbgT family transporter [Clostridioides difficile]|uniref:AbgT family transporter n=1 Tax=Clostridioides difficile TaxID=1496 RepID=UPI002FE5C987
MGYSCTYICTNVYDGWIQSSTYSDGLSYRCCITNPLSPLFPYFPIILAFTRKYDKDAGMGTVIANMIPYSISFLIVWTILLILFMVFNIPLGPGILPSYSM